LATGQFSHCFPPLMATIFSPRVDDFVRTNPSLTGLFRDIRRIGRPSHIGERSPVG